MIPKKYPVWQEGSVWRTIINGDFFHWIPATKRWVETRLMIRAASSYAKARNEKRVFMLKLKGAIR